MPARRRNPRLKTIDRDAILRRDARFDVAKPGRKKRSDAMMKSMAKVLQHWSRFSVLMHGAECDPLQSLRAAKVEDFRRYIEYRLCTGDFSKQSSIWTEWKILLCVVADETFSEVDLQIRQEMHGLLYGRFVDEYDLSLRAREKPVMSVEDLAVTLHHLWAVDRSVFPVERQRVQLAALLLTIAYTSSRPGALVEASCAAGSNECLTYKDVRLLVIPDPEKSTGNLLVMELSLTYTKGNRSSQKPTTYFFHERDDNLALCPILHFVALAIADNAFEACITCPEQIYHLKVPPERNSLQLRWKAEMLDIPVFRRSVKVLDGIATSSNKALTYDMFNKYLIRLGRSVGFKHALTAYCLRRGTANAVDGRHTDAERNQVLGHSRSEIFLRHYISTQVKADVQSAFLGLPVRDALIKAVGRMCLDRDVRVPQALTEAQKMSVNKSPELIALTTRKAELAAMLRKRHGGIKQAAGTSAHDRYTTLGCQYRALQKRSLDEKLEEVRQGFFSTIDTREVDAQLRPCAPPPPGADTIVATDAMWQPFDERARLCHSLFAQLELKVVEDDDVHRLQRRCHAISDLAVLSYKRETPRQHPTEGGMATSKALARELELLEFDCLDDPGQFPMECPSTVCLFCLGNENITHNSRMFAFSRKDALRRHVEGTHLQYVGTDTVFECPHPLCQAICLGHSGFKSHASGTHNIWH